ncbi:uncharacterized protein LOC143882944 [Tasmannia lanceolata]|uniref:uncharacterized protein LOC143882944 n=1 Tax=Tasmannia lanceolata TaxID=3420 RepID=UPI004063FB2A
MVKYLAKVHQLSSRFASFEVIRVPRTENAKADVLSKLAASGYTTLGSIRMEFLQRSSIEREAADIMQVKNEPCWMDEIIHYLRDAKLPEDKKEARKATILLSISFLTFLRFVLTLCDIAFNVL